MLKGCDKTELTLVRIVDLLDIFSQNEEATCISSSTVWYVPAVPIAFHKAYYCMLTTFKLGFKSLLYNNIV